MGRHGGGSKSGGSSRSSSRSSGGSRSGESSVRVSKTPFRGCYNRTYYDRRGHRHDYYTTDKDFGTKSGWNSGTIFAFAFITIHMILIVSGFASSFVTFGSKINGNIDRIMIVDNIDVLTEEEELKTKELLHQVYDASGMPVTVYTDSYDWKYHYNNLEVYSEELYYSMGYDEDAMIILFTAFNQEDFFDWEYDMYCGDDTYDCLSNATFDKLLNNFQKGMVKQNLYEALNYSWNSVMDELATISIDWTAAPVIVFFLIFYSIFYVSILKGVSKHNQAYKYFQSNPDKLSNEPMTLYSKCPSCNAPNTTQSETCAYCGTLLKISDANVQYVDPK